MELYLRSVLINKYALVACGVILVGAGLLGRGLYLTATGFSTDEALLLEFVGAVVLVMGVILFAGTDFGLETSEACRKTLESLEEFGVADPYRGRKYTSYCEWKGYELALRIWESRKQEGP